MVGENVTKILPDDCREGCTLVPVKLVQVWKVFGDVRSILVNIPKARTQPRYTSTWGGTPFLHPEEALWVFA